MSDPTEPEPLDAEFEPADETSEPDRQRKAGGIGGYFLTFFLSVLVGGGIGGWVAWTLDGMDEAAPLESRIAALEATPMAVAFDASALEARLAALEEASSQSESVQTNLDELEAALSASGNDPTLPIRVIALESSVQQIQALANQALDQIGEMSGGFDTEAIEARIAALEAQNDPPANIGDLTNIEMRIAALENTEPVVQTDLSSVTDRLDALESIALPDLTEIEDRISILENQLNLSPNSTNESSASSGTMAREALALMALAEAVNSGHPYIDALHNFERFAESETGVLRQQAEAGIMTVPMLARAFPAEAILATRVSERVFFGLIEVSDSSADARRLREQIPMIEERLALGDLNGAILLTGQLSADAQEAASDWRDAAMARQLADRRLEAIRMTMLVRQLDTEADPT
ncbi:MAG: hypothetical protein DHS20C06_10360 [Hyphobacterium sp.]|nr:MAG: hypothetical protein DHS20C06_10360 [Hyphobacterium sp.]